MTGRRKGTPCACETDPCSCGSSKGKCIRAINNLSPDANGDFVIEAGSGILITQTGDNSFEVSFDGTFPSNPLIYKGTVGSGGTVAVLPAADPDNIGWAYIAIEAATSPVTYEVGDVLISDGYTWQVVPSGDEIVPIVTAWQLIPDDQHVPSEKLVKDSLDRKLDKITNGINPRVYAHTAAYQYDIQCASAASTGTIMLRDANARAYGDDPANNTDLLCLVNVNTLNGRLTDGSVTKIGTSNVGSDTKPIKLVNGVPAAITNDLVDLPSAQAITGAKTVPLEATGTFSDQIASSNKVKNELDNYAPMVRTTGNQNILGQKTIESLIIGSDLNNKSTVTQFDSDTSKYCRMYTYNDSTGAQYKTFVVMITPKRVNINRTGLLYFGDNRNASPVIGWLLKGSDISNTDFVITKEADGTINLWCKTYTGVSDGYHGIRILEHTTSGLTSGYLEAVVNEEGYTISSTGYTDREGINHTFTYFVTPS